MKVVSTYYSFIVFFFFFKQITECAVFFSKDAGTWRDHTVLSDS